MSSAFHNYSFELSLQAKYVVHMREIFCSQFKVSHILSFSAQKKIYETSHLFFNVTHIFCLVRVKIKCSYLDLYTGLSDQFSVCRHISIISAASLTSSFKNNDASI